MENKNGLDGVGILLAEKWVDKDTDMIRVSDRMIVIKWLVQGIIISVISVYAQQCGLDNSRKDDFYDTLINIARKFEEKEIVIIARYFNGWKCPKNLWEPA